MANDSVGEIASYRYLVVDDEEFIRKLIIRVLGTFGVEAANIDACTSGQNALDHMAGADLPADIVLCDLNMPDMDGVEFLRHLAARSFHGGIVLISGEDQRILQAAEDLARAHDLNFLGALSKPVTPQALSALIGDFNPVRQERSARPDIELSVDDLKAAIEQRQISVVFQPKVSTVTKELVGVETLARWIHETKGFIPPDIFVRMAEEYGLIDDLTLVILDLAISQGGAWQNEGLDIKVAVNLSVDNLNSLELIETLTELADRHGMSLQNLTLEVTESRLMEDIAKPLEILTRMRMKGSGLSIDDFGTGHSSMEQLKRIPFTELKIDRAFVNGATHDKAARAILEASVGMAKSLNMSIVAEGAEDQEDWDLVAGLGCDLVQGYFVAKPMPGGNIAGWRRDWLASI